MVKLSQIGKWLAISGSILLLSVPIGLLFTAFDLYQDFNEITLYGTGDTENMKKMLSSALVNTVLGLLFALPSAILICIAIVIFNYRSKRIFYISIITSILTILMYPYGTTVAIITLIFIIIKRREFFPNVQAVT